MALFSAFIWLFVVWAYLWKPEITSRNDYWVICLDQQHFNYGCSVSQGWKPLHFSFITNNTAHTQMDKLVQKKLAPTSAVHHSSLSWYVLCLKITKSFKYLGAKKHKWEVDQEKKKVADKQIYPVVYRTGTGEIPCAPKWDSVMTCQGLIQFSQSH